MVRFPGESRMNTEISYFAISMYSIGILGVATFLFSLGLDIISHRKEKHDLLCQEDSE